MKNNKTLWVQCSNNFLSKLSKIFKFLILGLTRLFFMFQDLVMLIGFCLFSWQFSQFMFLTQTIALLILKWLQIVDQKFYFFYCSVHLSAISLVTLLTSNILLINSLYLALIIVSCCLSEIGHFLSKNLDLKIVTLLEITVTLVLSKIWKVYFTNSSDVDHIFNILKSKVSSYKDFHTMLYTCSPEFDFFKLDSYEALVKTFLIPTVIFAGFLICYYWYRNSSSQGFPNCIEPHIAYNILQTGAFIIMAIFFMRLKLFMTPHLCILAGLVCSKRYLEKIGLKNKLIQAALTVLLLSIMSYHGMQQIIKERSFVGKINDKK